MDCQRERERRRERVSDREIERKCCDRERGKEGGLKSNQGDEEKERKRYNERQITIHGLWLRLAYFLLLFCERKTL